MKHLLALLSIITCYSVINAQNNSIEIYPWNPDANNDNVIGATDILASLGVYGNEFGTPPEPCTYDGTPLEDLIAGITDESIILDSVFVEYEIQDISTYYTVGCPDPITDTVTFAHAVMLNNFSRQDYNNQWWAHGDGHEFVFSWNTATGTYRFRMTAGILSSLGFTDDGFFDYYIAYTPWVSIPFPDDWTLDSDGIHLDSGWTNDWISYANYIHILPYWHYAD